MSSAGKTANFELNQWVRTDGVCMDDFNADNAKIDAALASRARIQAGAYTGTGTFGGSSQNSLTFDFVPKAVFVASSNSPAQMMRYLNGVPQANTSPNDPNAYAYTFLSGATLRWYSPQSQYAQLNVAGVQYLWVAVG